MSLHGLLNSAPRHSAERFAEVDEVNVGGDSIRTSAQRVDIGFVEGVVHPPESRL